MLVLAGPLLPESLATQDLVRFQVFDNDVGGHDVVLVVGSSTLNLRYLTRASALILQVFVLDDAALGYGVYVPDGAEHEPLLWSVAENLEELSLLAHAVVGGGFTVALVDETGTNVASCPVAAAECDIAMAELFDKAVPSRRPSRSLVPAVARVLDLLAGKRQALGRAATCRLRLEAGWAEFEAVHVGRPRNRQTINIFTSDEGVQHESFASVLVEGLDPPVFYRSPRLRDTKNLKELTDLVLSHEYGHILVEAKALSGRGPSSPPDRTRAALNAVKDVRKASKQLVGAARSLRAGAVIVENTRERDVIDLPCTQPLHLIVLISSLDLLEGNDDFGVAFALDVMETARAFFHVLDTGQLVRLVAAAHYFAARTQLSKMEWFDYLLMRRAKHAAEVGHPSFDLRFLPEGAE